MHCRMLATAATPNHASVTHAPYSSSSDSVMDAYQKGPIIGEGTYGSVICATHKASGRQVAIKKVRMASGREEGVNMSVLRELKALQALQGPHVVELLDVFNTKSSLVLVFEYMHCR
eukprot:GHRQ01036027.1.p2 GENE.GHRQ01036027.1~~GHRQ01036027.1.p2  ORF type:complete len:117 (-),score=48.87 GHRQ01036027.1:169-519(-)